MIWLEGDPCEPITSGHTDGYVLCAPGGVVLVEAIDDKDVEPPLWREHDIALLENARDADDRKFKVVRVLAPRRRYWKWQSRDFRAVLSQCLCRQRRGDRRALRRCERDEAARKALAKAFPDARDCHVADRPHRQRWRRNSLPDAADADAIKGYSNAQYQKARARACARQRNEAASLAR